MPITLTFDIAKTKSIDYNRIQSFFERFGWENLGGTSYRYPKLGSEEPVEDWFNHVIPALMLFRTYIESNKCQLNKFTLDVQSSCGYNPDTDYGTPPESGKDITMYGTSKPHFGKKNLMKWIDSISYPY